MGYLGDLRLRVLGLKHLSHWFKKLVRGVKGLGFKTSQDMVCLSGGFWRCQIHSLGFRRQH